MVRIFEKLTALLLVISLLVLPVEAARGMDAADMVDSTRAGLSALGGKAGKLLNQGADFPAGTSVCDWVAIALALGGSPEDYDAYAEALEAYVEEAYARDGGLDRVKSTTYHRIALAVMALGRDPEHFGTLPDGSSIDLIRDGTYGFAGSSLGAQGLNGWIYALLTLDASGVRVPENGKYTREDMIGAIVSAQEPDGGFGLTAGKSDVDITAMALQALAPYAGAYPQVVEAGLGYLSGAMNDNCRYTAYGAESAESSAQVILALCALDIDPVQDPRFCRNGADLLTGLAGFAQEDGTYGHNPGDGEGNYLATAQTLLALEAMEKRYAGAGWIFDFTDYAGPRQKEPSVIPYAVGIGAAAGILCIVIAGKRRKYGKNNG